MKYFTTVALVAAFAGIGVAACSSGDDDDSGNDGGANSTAGSGGNKAGASTGGSISIAGNSTTGGNSTVGGNSTGGHATGGGGASTTAGSGGASGGSGGASGGASGGSGGAGGGGGGGNPNAVVTSCGDQKYTPATTPGAACATKAVPAAALIAAFDTAGPAAGWGVYPNVDNMTGFTPTTATPSAGGANGTAMSLAYVVTNLAQGIKLQVGFGTQCQDVRTFKGLSFWAKGTIDAATMPFAVDANTLVIQVGAETSLLGGCQGATCSAAPPDKRVTIAGDWKEYRIPFDCFGDGKVFDGYYTNVLFSAFGTNSNFAIDQVGYY